MNYSRVETKETKYATRMVVRVEARVGEVHVALYLGFSPSVLGRQSQPQQRGIFQTTRRQQTVCNCLTTLCLS